MTQYKHLLFGLIWLLGLTACGGGGDGDADNSTPNASPAEEPTVTMANIKVAADYDFTTSQQQAVNIDLRNITNQRAYISFYQQWKGDDNAPIPNPDSLLLMQATDTGQISRTLTVGKQQPSLLMLIMFTDPQLSPVTQVFPVDTNNEFQYP